MRVLIAGLGSIGRRHLANVQKLMPSATIVALRRTGSVEEVAGVTQVHNLEEALDQRPDVAILSGPASTHVPLASAMANEGVHLLIEKPLSDSLTGVMDLVEMTKRRGIIAMVAYNLRFDYGLAALRAAAIQGTVGSILAVTCSAGMYLPDWRRGSDYRAGVSARKELGGGAVLELSHELDYCHWIAGEAVAVKAEVTRTQHLQIDVEDSADILLRFESGAAGNIHVDMLDRAPNRMCRVVGTEGSLVWDGITRSTQAFRQSDRTWSELVPGSGERSDTYITELRHFFECVQNGNEPCIPLAEGVRTLRTALAAKEAASCCGAIDPRTLT